MIFATSCCDADLQLLSKPIVGVTPTLAKPHSSPAVSPISIKPNIAISPTINAKPASSVSPIISKPSNKLNKGEKTIRDAHKSPNNFVTNPLSDDCVSDYTVDYVILVLSWSPGICATGKFVCKKQKNEFTIHGLWPQLDDQAPTKCCTKQRYNDRVLDQVRRKLKAVWPTLNMGKDEDFWFYEWNKHGRCADNIEGINTVEKYFEFALKEYSKLDLANKLIKEGIEPSRHSTYYGDDIQLELNRLLGTDVELFCAPKANDPSQMLLTEIGVCYDMRNLRRINCRQWKRSCMGELVFNTV